MTETNFINTEDQPVNIEIPYRRIICKNCALEGDTEAGFSLSESSYPERVKAVCEKCGTENHIKIKLCA